MTSVRRWDMSIALPKYNGLPGEVFWHRIGAIFENEKGQLSIKFYSLPIANQKGEVWANGFIPEEREEEAKEKAPAQKQERQTTTRRNVRSKAIDDEIEF